MKALQAGSGGKLGARDKKVLEELERDVARVKKARDAVGDKAPSLRGDRGAREGGGGGGGGGRGSRILGKRGRDERAASEGSETDESVRAIPMPKDTPPPVPPRNRPRDWDRSGGNANLEPLGEGRGGGERQPHGLPEKPPAVPAQTVYEAKPAVRDLRKEAVNRFVPSVVQRKLEAKGGKGGRLLEEEEVERLEKEGYGKQRVETGEGSVVEATPKVKSDRQKILEEEEERFERELRGVQEEDENLRYPV